MVQEGIVDLRDQDNKKLQALEEGDFAFADKDLIKYSSVEQYLTEHTWTMKYQRPDETFGQRTLQFLQNGRIGEGANIDEDSWKLNKESFE